MTEIPKADSQSPKEKFTFNGFSGLFLIDNPKMVFFMLILCKLFHISNQIKQILQLSALVLIYYNLSYQ